MRYHESRNGLPHFADRNAIHFSMEKYRCGALSNHRTTAFLLAMIV